MKKHKSLLVVFLAFIMMFMIASNVSAASAKKEEKQVRKTMNGFISVVKNYNPSKIRSYFVRPSYAKVFLQKRYTAKVIRTINKRYFTAHIDSIRVKKKTATVVISGQHFSDMDACEKALDDMVLDILSHPHASSLKLDKRFAQNYSTYIKKDLAFYTDDAEGFNYVFISNYRLKISLRKVGRKWKISKKMNVDFLDTIHADYESAYLDYFD